ncbi:MAG: relaxase MobL, partial [Staphylococcus warneri]|nr:relaxase MobL [Staphylococcus warneri]
NNSLKHIRPEIDKITDMYIKQYHPKEFEDFKDKLFQQTNIYKSTYGENSNYNNYTYTKIDDLYSRSGNTILSNIKSLNQSDKYKPFNDRVDFKSKIKSKIELNKSIYYVKRGLKNDFKTSKNINQYDREFGIDKELEKDR